MPKFIRRFIKGGGGGGRVADKIKQWLAELETLDESERQEWWWVVAHEYVVDWLEATEARAPKYVQGNVATLELNWYRLRRKELSQVLIELDELDPSDMGPHHPDCMRALVSNACSILGAMSNQ